MRQRMKIADVDPGSAASPLPQTSVVPTPAPGKRGPVGMGSRNNFSRVNTGAPFAPDAGVQEQKSMAPRGAEMLPKLGFIGEDSMKTSAAARPSLQDMIKAASAGTLSRISIAEEAAHQQQNLGEEKTASADSDQSLSTEFANQLANAVEYLANEVKTGAQLAGGYTLSENKQEVGSGPGALHVMQAEASVSPPGPGQQGAGHHQPPKNPGLEKAHHQEHSPTNLETDAGRAPGGGGKMLEKNNSALFTSNLEALRKIASGEPKVAAAPEPDSTPSLVDIFQTTIRKTAEDAINPAHISAGPASTTELQTSAAGESGGEPVGGAPQGPTGLVASNESAINYKRNQAYGNRKTDSAKYWSEPALSSATDKTLQEAFAHTSEAGTKFSSAQPSIKTAAAKALLQKLADQAEKKAEKEKDEAFADKVIQAPRPGVKSMIAPSLPPRP